MLSNTSAAAYVFGGSRNNYVYCIATGYGNTANYGFAFYLSGTAVGCVAIDCKFGFFKTIQGGITVDCSTYNCERGVSWGNVASADVNLLSYYNSGYGFYGVHGGVSYYSATQGTSSSYATGSDDLYVIGNSPLTADPYTNSATPDMSLNDTAGGGAVAQGSGPWGHDAGAAQNNDGASGGGGTVLIIVED